MHRPFSLPEHGNEAIKHVEKVAQKGSVGLKEVGVGVRLSVCHTGICTCVFQANVAGHLGVVSSHSSLYVFVPGGIAAVADHLVVRFVMKCYQTLHHVLSG